MKILEIINFYSLDEIKAFIEKGGKYPLHHIWCYDQFEKHGYEVACVAYNRNSFWNKFGTKLKINNLQQQIRAIRQSKKFDVIFIPTLQDGLLLYLLKILHLFSKPVLAIAHLTYSAKHNNPIKRTYQKLLRIIYFSGVDKILFLNEQTYNQSKIYSYIPERHHFLSYWGVDYDFFQQFYEQQNEEPTMDYVFATGGSNRDFNTLVKAFNELPFQLRIATKWNLGIDSNIPLTSKIKIDNSIEPGLSSLTKLLPEYYHAFAVAVPLEKEIEICTGITVIFEAMSMGKPIIATKNDLYPIDIEKERIGIVVDHGDVEAWKNAINYLFQHPNEAKEMGDRGRELIKERYNYQNFSKEIINVIESMQVKIQL